MSNAIKLIGMQLYLCLFFMDNVYAAVSNKLMVEQSNKISAIEKVISEQTMQIKYLSDSVSNHIAIFTWISGISIAIVGVIFTAGTIFMIIKNIDAVRSAELLLNQCKTTLTACDVTRDNHEILLKDLKDKLANELTEITTEKRRVIHDYNYFILLSNEISKEPINQPEIYRLLTPLVTTPHKEYLALFKTIVQRNINGEITELTEKAIAKCTGSIQP